MAEITVSVNSRPFQVVCRDGEEAQVSQLAEDLAARVAAIKKGNEKAGDSHLLVLAGLVLSNDVRDLKRELEAVRQEMGEAGRSRERCLTASMKLKRFCRKRLMRRQKKLKRFCRPRPTRHTKPMREWGDIIHL